MIISYRKQLRLFRKKLSKTFLYTFQKNVLYYNRMYVRLIKSGKVHLLLFVFVSVNFQNERKNYGSIYFTF